MLRETPASSPLSVSTHRHSSARACVFSNQGRAEGGREAGKERKGVQRPRSPRNVESAAGLRVYLSCSRMTCKFLGPLSLLDTVRHCNERLL